MFRTCIFVIYQKDGILPTFLMHLLTELNENVNKLVVVINGVLNEIGKIKDIADVVIIRENVGFDAGALKCALHNSEVKALIQGSDELLFCNDTFYGPFVPFYNVFFKMQKTNADFWGLNLSDNGLTRFLQSYFLVFKKSVLKSGTLYDFFDAKINENETSFKSVLKAYEQGIFNYLVNKGFSYDFYNKQEYHVLKAADTSVILDKLPILKIKFFSKDFYNETKALNALAYIYNNYDFDISLILSDVKKRFNLEISMQQVQSHKIKELNVINKGFDYFDLPKILDFVEKYKPIYIYGCGVYGQLLLKALPRGVVKGFIVSDAQNCNEELEGIPIRPISFFDGKIDVPIVVALNMRNTNEVRPLLEKKKYVLYLG